MAEVALKMKVRKPMTLAQAVKATGKDVYREILKTDQQMFEFFTNSFLIILEKEKNEELPLYISYNNMRKEKY